MGNKTEDMKNLSQEELLAKVAEGASLLEVATAKIKEQSDEIGVLKKTIEEAQKELGTANETVEDLIKKNAVLGDMNKTGKKLVQHKGDTYALRMPRFAFRHENQMRRITLEDLESDKGLLAAVIKKGGYLIKQDQKEVEK